ncbi:MAG: hypothetical protein ISR65_02135 [Bacteriovoracaceae bacterium]|nr:hypothetical protein [Bacteriovoracaceae bacterium]
MNVATKKQSVSFYFVFSVLCVWCIYTVTTPTFLLKTNPLNGTLKNIVAQVICLKILIVTFATLYYRPTKRLFVLSLGSLAILAVGTYVGFYNLSYALQSIDISTLSLLFGMGLISTILAATNCFKVVTNRLIEMFGKYHFALFVILVLLTYFFSLFINNLTTMLLILPVTLTLADTLKLKATPFIIGQIIASNLGGASSMLGDFPNMLIASKMHIPFHLFIKHMMPICLINLGVMLLYFYRKVDFGDSATTEDKLVQLTLPNASITNSKALNLSILVLITMIGFFMFSRISPGIVALVGAGILLAFSSIDKEEIIARVNYTDLGFFLLLFVLIGGVESSGLLETVSDGVLYVSGGNEFVRLLILMWGASFVTMFFNAGPTTILFLPMFLGVSGLQPHNLIFWALSLGICAGSSGSLNGATAGPVSLTLMEKFYRNDSKTDKREHLTYASYSIIGFPIMYLHLLISTLYVLILYWMSFKY